MNCFLKQQTYYHSIFFVVFRSKLDNQSVVGTLLVDEFVNDFKYV